MRNVTTVVAVLALLVGVWTIASIRAVAQVDGNDNNVAVMDDCLPGDPGWAPTGGCELKPHQGDVPAAEFFGLLTSPLTIPPNGSLIGHPSWRNEPSYLTVRVGKNVRVTNRGGRLHTFTEVNDFGGGFIPQLNIGLSQSPQCTPAGSVSLPPGATVTLTGLTPGLHKYQCCIHPWMRAAIRVD